MKVRIPLTISLVAAGILFGALTAGAQNDGGFGGFQQDLSRFHFSEKFTDVDYAGDGQEYHRLDIYLPEAKQEKYPVVIHIYGSAWFSNNSKGMADLGTICAAYLDAGYAVVTPNHRSSMDAKWPAQIHDIKAVIRFVRGEAEKYHFDTSFIATSGFSSGGHLASMAAVTTGMKSHKVGSYEIDLEGSIGSHTDQSSDVNAACDWSGPVDLMNMDCAGVRDMQMSPEEVVIGLPMAGNEDRYRSLSAPTYINANTPPVIVTHGTDDNVVPCCVGTDFYQALEKAGVICELNVVQGGGHGFNMYADENLSRAVAFLDRARGVAAAVTGTAVGTAAAEPVTGTAAGTAAGVAETGAAASGAGNADVTDAQNPAPNTTRSTHPWMPVTSPVVNPDNTVTFNFKNDNAKDVKVNVQFSGIHQMTRDDDGIWSVTVGPAASDMYPYCFIVDGISIMDPANPDWFPNEGFKNSILDIRGTEPTLHSIQNVPHGSVDYISYRSEAIGAWNSAVVYTPPSYERNPGKKYPVFYLISGTTDTEEVYFKVGRMNFILDNLIAAGKAQEMIIVLPYGNPSNLLSPSLRAPFDFTLFSKDLLGDLMPFVEKNYRALNDRDSRAIGGFSRGGNQALSIGLTNLDKFSWLCSYSSFTSQELPGVYDDAATLNSKINLFWLGVGTDDFLYGSAKEYMNFLDKKGIRNVQYFTDDKFGHTWMNAKCFLGETLPLLFDRSAASRVMKEASRETMADASFGRVPSGSDQKLTPAKIGKLFPKPVISPDYQDDGIVTFRFKAPDAALVELNCQAFSANKPMEKDADGIWNITVKIETPDIYPYCFMVDGMQVADPSNMYIFPNEGFKNSLVDVRRPEPSVQDVQDVPHGRVSYRFYHSSRLGFDRPLCVYTPAGYSPSGSEKLPVLYLIHGMTDTYETWYKVGRVNVIMDNLIAQGLAKRMIVVMPYANPYPEMMRRGTAQMYDPMNTEIVAREIIDEIVPFIESNYSTRTDADSRAVAGFSLGGRQTLATGLGNPELFHYVAAFSPAIFMDEWNTNFDKGVYAEPSRLKSELKLMRLCCGTEDFLLKSSQGLDTSLTERGVEHVTYWPGGGHTWMNCRDYIEMTAKELFK